MSYSVEYRKEILKQKEIKGWTDEKVAEHFNVSVRSIIRWKKSIEPKQYASSQETIRRKEKILTDLQKYPDSYAHERTERLNISKSAVGRFIKILGYSRKKNTKTPTS